MIPPDVQTQNSNNEQIKNNICLPIVVEFVEAQNKTDLPIVVEPIEAQNSVDLPIEVENNDDLPKAAENESHIWIINYEKELQGLIITDQEIEPHYYDIHTALVNTFVNHSGYAILILEGFIMALIKQMESFYSIDSHARGHDGMPDPNGTAVIMKFADILDLEQYLLSLSISLHTNLFEIVSVQLTATATNRQCSIETVNKKMFDFKRTESLIKERGKRTVTLLNKLDFKVLKSTKKESSQWKLIVRDN